MLYMSRLLVCYRFFFGIFVGFFNILTGFLKQLFFSFLLVFFGILKALFLLGFNGFKVFFSKVIKVSGGFLGFAQMFRFFLHFKTFLNFKGVCMVFQIIWVNIFLFLAFWVFFNIFFLHLKGLNIFKGLQVKKKSNITKKGHNSGGREASG